MYKKNFKKEDVENNQIYAEKILTLDEFTINKISQYPKIYLKYSFEQSQLAILNQVLNVIGSGSDDFEKYIIGKTTADDNIEKFFGESKVFEKKENGEYVISLIEDEDSVVIKKDKIWKLNPYPNF